MTIFCATVQRQQNNNHYANSHFITSAANLKVATAWDHVPSGYVGGYGANENFITYDCVVMDNDNDHTGNSDEWVTQTTLRRFSQASG